MEEIQLVCKIMDTNLSNNQRPTFDRKSLDHDGMLIRPGIREAEFTTPNTGQMGNHYFISSLLNGAALFESVNFHKPQERESTIRFKSHLHVCLLRSTHGTQNGDASRMASILIPK